MKVRTVIRQGTPEDTPPALTVWRSAEETGRGDPVSPERHGRRVRAHVDNPDAFLFGAESGAEYVGMAVGMQGLSLHQPRLPADGPREGKRPGRDHNPPLAGSLKHWPDGLRASDTIQEEAEMGGEDWRGRWQETNMESWDERVPIHVGGEFYGVEAFKAGEEHLRPFEIAEVGDVSGRDLLHLQCHFGKDTLSWARRGARVTGLDFSAPAVEAARNLAGEMGIDAEFVQSDVYKAGDVLGGRTFDIVYTGLGALNWLPDITRWAAVAAGLVRPGGFLYLAEFHPFTTVFGDDGLTVEHDYFHKEEPDVWDEPGTYADFDAETVNNVTYEWNHTLSDVVTALIDAGLVLQFLHEHDYTLFPRWPILEKSGFDTYRLPEGTPRIPLMYSLLARRPR